MDPSNDNKNTADDGQAQSQHLEVEEKQRRRQSSNLFRPPAPEERPYRRRIKPPPDKVHHVQPARFRRFVQSRTCCSLSLRQPNDDEATASATTTSAVTTELELQPPPPPSVAAIGGIDVAYTGAGRLDVPRKSMQDAYMEWCSSNDMPLSPGTMAELSFTVDTSKDHG